ncbi:MAG: BtrH N-terminal domain-containing protein [Deinococcales bacterium]
MHLENFPNLVGAHCSSSAVRSVLAYDGLYISEALAFGLGSGLGFFYNIEPEGSPTRRFNGRAPDLEGNFFRLAGQPLQWLGSWQPEAISQALALKRPIIAQTDIYPIPYYDGAHFIGHGLVVVGLEGNIIKTADIAAQELSEMPLEAFHAAIREAYPPLNQPYHYAVCPVVREIKLVEMVPEALARTVLYMLEPPPPPKPSRHASPLTRFAQLERPARSQLGGALCLSSHRKKGHGRWKFSPALC